MVDKNVGKLAVTTRNTYLYKNVEISCLLMQDDKLTTSTCGGENNKNKQFLDTQTNIIKLQFRKNKYVKYTYTDDQVDVCKDILVTKNNGLFIYIKENKP